MICQELMAQAVKNLPARDEVSIPGSGRPRGRGKGNPLRDCLENSIDRGGWRAAVHAVSKVEHDLATKPNHRVNTKPGLKRSVLMFCLLSASADSVRLGAPRTRKKIPLGLACREKHPWWENKQKDSMQAGETVFLFQWIYWCFVYIKLAFPQQP